MAALERHHWYSVEPPQRNRLVVLDLALEETRQTVKPRFDRCRRARKGSGAARRRNHCGAIVDVARQRKELQPLSQVLGVRRRREIELLVKVLIGVRQRLRDRLPGTV